MPREKRYEKLFLKAHLRLSSYRVMVEESLYNIFDCRSETGLLGLLIFQGNNNDVDRGCYRIRNLFPITTRQLTTTSSMMRISPALPPFDTRYIDYLLKYPILFIPLNGTKHTILPSFPSWSYLIPSYFCWNKLPSISFAPSFRVLPLPNPLLIPFLHLFFVLTLVY